LILHGVEFLQLTALAADPLQDNFESPEWRIAGYYNQKPKRGSGF